MSRRLARHFTTMEALTSAGVAELAAVEGVGPERAAAIAEDLAELAPVIARLLTSGVNLSEAALQISAGGPLVGKTVVVTGNLGRLSRTEAQAAVERLGGKPTSSVSKKTDLLVIGEAPGAAKVDKAAELAIATMNAETFLALLDA
jgi:DNA ligase (NAD+)